VVDDMHQKKTLIRDTYLQNPPTTKMYEESVEAAITRAASTTPSGIRGFISNKMFVTMFVCAVDNAGAPKRKAA